MSQPKKRVRKADVVLNEVTAFYLTSGDFNGIPIRTIIARCQVQSGRVKGILRTLLQEGKITLEFGDRHPNPHVKALPEDPPDKQEEKLAKAVLRSGAICVYPSPAHLRTVVPAADYQGRPFTFRLALGEPQLTHVSFNLQVLEFYRNDPRYYYRNDDVQGHIGIKDEFYESEQMPASDQILLERFGFSYNSKLNRAVAVFLRYLSRLSPEHQQLWNTRIVQGDYQLHPAYFEATILGRWYEKIPIFHAFLEEQEIINTMCELMGRPPLFREVFKEDKKPRGFGFLIRPTLREFNDFVHLLDKMLSDNLNKKFFGDDIPLEQEEVRNDGKIIVRDVQYLV
jgi:hypothetical protein